ncbi:MAG: J domain-containing protein [Chloroflexi bacterium]|nr:J domain-containing protein [Chloroflexota bacterium]
MRDYYQVLGVPRTASAKEVRDAYRRLARQYHPDVNPGNKAAEEHFKAVNEAYEVLSDPEKRRLYDQFGENWRFAQRAGVAPGEQGTSTGRTFTWQPGQEPFGDLFDNQDLDDLLGRFFGGAGGAGRGRRAAEQEVELSLEEAFSGAGRTLELPVQEPCSRCGGSGRQVRGTCPTCLGRGFTSRTARYQVTIPPGVDDGSRVRVAPGGHEMALVVKVRPHPRFQRKGTDLYTQADVPLYDAMLGSEVVVPTLTGRAAALTIPPETQNGATFRLAGQGMPNLGDHSRRGDLYVQVRVELPKQLSDEERALVHHLRELRKAASRAH